MYIAVHKDLIRRDIDNISSNLKSVSSCAASNGLLLNVGKTQAIRISGCDWASDIPQIDFDGTSIEYGATVRYLGVLIDGEL